MVCDRPTVVKDRYSWKPVCLECGRRVTRSRGRWMHTRWFGMV
jgi:hypothetical protein